MMTAVRPTRDPTDRSMPPVMMTGVSAIESSPSSTLNLSTSKKFVQPKNHRATKENRTDSAIKAARSQRSPLLRLEGPRSPATGDKRNFSGLFTIAACHVDRDRDEDDGALNCVLPVRADAEECETCADRAEQDDSEDGAEHGSRAARDRCTADDHGGDHLHLEAEPCVAGDLMEPDGVERGRQAGECTGQSEDREDNAFRSDSHHARSLLARSDCEDSPACAQVTQTEGRKENEENDQDQDGGGELSLSEVKPLKARRQISDP